MNFSLYLAIFLLVDLLLIIYVLYRKSRRTFSKRELIYFQTEWQRIFSLQDGKHAVMEADKLLHHVLGKKGYAGTVGEQLKKAEKVFTSIDNVWSAHKLRNRIAHELDVRITPGEKQNALRAFEKALKDLRAL
jgi:hypothetical protein